MERRPSPPYARQGVKPASTTPSMPVKTRRMSRVLSVRGAPRGHGPFYSHEQPRVAHRLAYGIQRRQVGREYEAAEAVADGAVRAFEQSRLTGVRRVRTIAVAGVGSVHRRLSIVVHERHLECWVTWVNLE